VVERKGIEIPRKRLICLALIIQGAGGTPAGTPIRRALYMDCDARL